MTVPFPSEFPLDAGSLPPKHFADAGGPAWKEKYYDVVDDSVIEDRRLNDLIIEELGDEEDSELPPWAFRARSIVNDVRSHPMDDDQAVALAQVYALLAIEEALGRMIR